MIFDNVVRKEIKKSSKNGRKRSGGYKDTMAGRRVRPEAILKRLGVDRLTIDWRSFGGFFFGADLVSKDGLLPIITLIGS